MIQEFICPNGRMSVNGVCPIFEGSDGQVKDFKKKSTYDALKEDEIFGEKDIEKDIEKDRKKSGFFKFDFEKDTPSKFESAKNLINSNIDYYNNFVEDKLGIPANVQTAFRVGSAAYSAFTGGSLLSVAAPFAIPFVLGGALKNNEENRIRNITMQDTQGDIQTTPVRIMNIQPTAQDVYRGGGQYNKPSRPSKSYRAPQQTSGPGGLHSNY